MFINHCHVFPKGEFDKENPDRGTIEHLTEIIDLLEIERAIVFAPFKSFVSIDNPNEWLIKSLKQYPNILGFATLDPKLKKSVASLEKCAANGLAGVKIHPPIFKTRIDAPICFKFYAKAQELNVPVLFHTGVHGWRLSQYMPILIDEIAQRFPELMIIIEHIGGIDFFDQSFAVLKNNNNCYAGITTTLQGRDGWHIPREKIVSVIKKIRF